MKVLNRKGSGTYDSIIEVVKFVAANGVSGDVANMSMGGGYSEALNSAVETVAATGILLLGNIRTDVYLHIDPDGEADPIRVYPGFLMGSI